MYDRRMIECVEGLIWSSFSGVEVSSELFPVSVLIDTGFVCFIIDLSWFSAIAMFVGCVSALPTYGIWLKGEVGLSSTARFIMQVVDLIQFFRVSVERMS